MKVNAYVVVFGVIGIIIVAAGVSTLLSTQNTTGGVPNLHDYGPAPAFKGVAAWINSPPLNITELRGKVVLVDFWTYSCINCIRTIPYLNAWYDRYSSNGLVIVGVHTPEFQFEKDYANVVAAVKQFGIQYPVALDSNSSTWNAYSNQYWPADYLIDANGHIRDTHFGEGGYNTTETLIQELLISAGYKINTSVSSGTISATSVNFAGIGTPEIYLGYATARAPIGNPQGFSPNEVVYYTIVGPMKNNTVYLHGQWYDASDSILSEGNSSDILLIYDAKNVNVVAEGTSSTITITLDGKNLAQSYLGSDVSLQDGVATGQIGAARLYNIVAGPSYGWHTLEITAGAGFRIYTFTFG